MSLGLVSEHSLWFIPLCLVLAFAYSFLLYHKDSKFEDVRKLILKTMFAIRFVAVFFLLFLLLAPMLRYFSTTLEKPIIVFAQDNSRSVLINKDSVYYKSQFVKEVERLKEKLSQRYELAAYTFGAKVTKDGSFDFNEKQTDIAQMFDEISTRFTNRNLGAVVLLSDGIYNKGANPLNVASAMDVPVYSVALGDTVPQRDLAVSQLRTNKTAFLNTKFPVQISVSANQLLGRKAKLVLLDGDKSIFEQDILIGSNSYFRNFDLLVDADKVGAKHLRAKLTTIEGEISAANNSKDAMVDVVDSKQKILIIGNSPHPDLNAIYVALQQNLAYDVSLSYPDKIKKSLKEYNLVILHQLPSNTNSFTTALSDLLKNQVPVLFILGGQSSVPSINSLKTFVTVNQQNQQFEESQALVNKNFSLFELSDEIREAVENNPPLLVPFGDYKISGGSEVLIYQKVKGVSTSKPQIVFSSSGDSKLGFIFGEGLWRWKTYMFVHTGQHRLFEDFVGKIAQYMSLKAVKDNFVVGVKKIYGEEEPIEFSAEVYNQSYELVDNAKVSLELEMPDKKKMAYELYTQKNKSKKYVANIGSLPVGKYFWKAKAELGGKTYSKAGQIDVLPLQVEADNSMANHQLLNQLSSIHGGRLFSPNRLDELYQTIMDSKEIAPVAYSEKKLQDLISFKPIFFLLLLLLSLEWLIRKYNGGY